MSLPKRKSRSITVDGIEYRWLKSTSPPPGDLRVELCDEPASQLVVSLASASGGHVAQVGPGMVASIIKRARAQGWLPHEREPRSFVLVGVEDLVTAGDLRARQAMTCLIIAPFDAGAGPVRRTLAGAVHELGVQVREAADASDRESATSAILGWIGEADFVLADVTRKNPNVLYEVGYAHALGKQTILLVDEGAESSVPSALAGNLIIPYSQQQLAGLKESVQRSVLRAIRSRVEP